MPEIDQLRAFAALLVFFCHCFQLFGARLSYGTDFDPARHWVRSLNPIVAAIEEGHSGVGLFIVLSGFVLSLGVLGRRIDYGRFVVARIARWARRRWWHGRRPSPSPCCSTSRWSGHS